MSTFTTKQIEVVGHITGTSTPTFWAPEGSAQVFKRGQLLIISAGQLVLSGDAPATVTVVGIAQQDATGVQATMIPYLPLLAGTLVKANLRTIAGTYTSIAGDILSSFAFGLVGSGATAKFVCNEDVRFSDTDKGDQLGLVIVSFDGDAVSGSHRQAVIGDIDPPVLCVVVGSIFTQGLTTEVA